jgi:DNA-binding FadR family transcriptional regulator
VFDPATNARRIASVTATEATQEADGPQRGTGGTRRGSKRASAPSAPRSLREGIDADVDTDRRLGDETARRIESDIVAAGREVGSVFGSQAELMERYDVSRAVFREAVRVLEHLGVARMRRGPGGGLVVTAPDPTAVLAAVIGYVTYERISLEEVLKARAAFDDAVARRATEARAELSHSHLLELLHDEAVTGSERDAQLQLAIAAATGNPAFELFTLVLAHLHELFDSSTRLGTARKRAMTDDARAAQRSMVDAIVAGDAESAGRAAVQHVMAGRALLSPKQLERTLQFGDAMDVDAAEANLAPRIARMLYARVVASGWPVGELLGSEAELLEDCGVSRSVLREALRLLELKGVVRTRRGPGGGIFITAPTRTPVVESMAAFLDAGGVSARHLLEVRTAVEVTTVTMAIRYLDAAGEERLRQVLRDEAAAVSIRPVTHRLHEVIAELTGNRVLTLFLEVLTRLVELRIPTSAAELDMTEEEAKASVQRVHRKIAEAILARDEPAARRAMIRHLEALVPFHR